MRPSRKLGTLAQIALLLCGLILMTWLLAADRLTGESPMKHAARRLTKTWAAFTLADGVPVADNRAVTDITLRIWDYFTGIDTAKTVRARSL